MAWSVGRATWVGELTDPEIAQQVGSRTFERGVAYAAQHRVRSLAARPEGMMLLGTVEGTGSQTYQTIVEARPHPKGRSPLWAGRCSCPVGSDCKHVVALLLLARDVANGKPPPAPADDSAAERADEGEDEATGPAGGSAAHAFREVHWADVLGHVRPRAREPEEPVRPEPRGELMPAGLFVDTIYRSGGWQREPEIGYGLRATRWTRTGSWHRSLTWHDALPQWRSGIRYLPEHERIMARLRDEVRSGSGSTTYFTAAAPLALDASPGVWSLLREAQEAGIPLLPGEGVTGPVHLLTDPAELVLHVLRADDDSGDLVLRVTTDGLPEDLLGEVVHIGDPVHGMAVEADDGSLTLLPLQQDLGLDRKAVFQALAGLRVPAEERGGFLRSAVPGLRDRVRVRSEVPLPAPEAADPSPEQVQVHVHVVGDVPGEVRLDLGFAYDGRVRSFTTARFGGAARDRAAEVAALEAATSLHRVPGAAWRDSTGLLHLATRVELKGVDAARFVGEQLGELEADEHVVVVVEGELPAYEEVTSAPVIRLGTGDQGADVRPGPGAADSGPTDWFDLHVSIEVGGEEVPFEPLFAALAAGEEVMLLESGSWFRLDRPELTRLRELIEEAREIADPTSEGLRLSSHHVDLWEELAALGVVDRQSARWAANVEALRSEVALPPAPVPTDLRATLRPYQLEGYHWLARLWDARVGGILADDMGLGKTLQVIAVLARAHEREELGGAGSEAAARGRGPVLVVVPTSVIGTWLGEFEAFAPHLHVTAVTDTGRKRGTAVVDAIKDAQVVVTSYAVLRLDDEAFREVEWGGVVLDEAQFVKNRQAKTHVAVRRLGSPFTVAVTGTPLENSLMDLWSLLSLTAPGLYPRPDVFTKNYRKPIESGARPELLDHLRRRIRPLMLRRTKEQVALDLPPKQIQVLPIEPHPVHRHIYDQHLQRERQRVLGLLGDPEGNRVAILAALTRLRQLALDPSLVDEAHHGKATAAKIDFLVEQLRELAAEGHRALVFSQFTGFLRIVERALDDAGLRTCYLDGSTTDRQSVIRGFRDGEAAAFLISLKAGGFGLTLTEADYVFVLDPWWNPAAEAQAIDRAHRIGQSKPVTVYRLVSAGTIEEKVVALQERKRDLFQRVVDEGGALAGAITSEDVRDLLELA
ncbi:DEAD/DEAH box helicase [Intrasporangium sp.]|uniref:DEAD/DEAH box helicase n=1 Tax=Intrasporangium sp. TaxID=1925024 RepID=UPI00293B3D94|nr:DEAD/DEAH box helicase [Intrasporangium sp.]MDV3221121.1 DEAD/DEAH box helicase [Intrasporangium sp.]